MPLTADEIVLVRRQVGSRPDDVTLQSTYTRVGTVNLTVLEVLELRYADLLADPTQFSVSGEYSQSTGENLKALAKKIAAWRAYMIGLGEDPGPGALDLVVTISEPDTTPWR